MFLITQDNKVYKAQVYLHDNGMALAERLQVLSCAAYTLSSSQNYMKTVKLLSNNVILNVVANNSDVSLKSIYELISYQKLGIYQLLRYIYRHLCGTVMVYLLSLWHGGKRHNGDLTQFI